MFLGQMSPPPVQPTETTHYKERGLVFIATPMTGRRPAGTAGPISLAGVLLRPGPIARQELREPDVRVLSTARKSHEPEGGQVADGEWTIFM